MVDNVQLSTLGTVIRTAHEGLSDSAFKKYLGSNLQTGTTYTLVLGDAGEIVEMNNASANTLTVPPNSSVAFPVNTRIDINQHGAGLTTVAAGAGVTVRSLTGLVSQGQYAGMSLWKRATDEWVLYGGTTA